MYRSLHFVILSLVLLLSCFLSFPATASALQLSLTWEGANAQNVAGSRVYYRKEGQAYNFNSPAWQGAGTTCTLSGLADDTAYYFVVRVYDANGNESANSNEGFYNPPSPPPPPLPPPPPAPQDTDNDGMSDSWEQENGLDPFVDDAAADFDGDGISNIDEYVAGSDPRVHDTNNPPLQPRALLPVNGEINVSLFPDLEIEEFIDPDVDDYQTLTQWQIIREHDDFIALDVLRDTSPTILTVPDFVLEENTIYYWKARFYDRFGQASDWSDISFFTTNIRGNDENADGIPDNQEVDDLVDTDENGTPDYIQLKFKSIFTEVGSGQLGLSFEDSTTVTAIETVESVDPDTINDTTNKPESLPLGLINFKLRVKNPGDRAVVTIHFSEPAPPNAKWYKYDSVNGWHDFSDYAVFSANGKSVTVELKDGGSGDADGVENGVIIDPSGFGITSALDSISGAGSGGGGCFIGTAQNSFLLEALVKPFINFFASLFPMN